MPDAAHIYLRREYFGSLAYVPATGKYFALSLSDTHALLSLTASPSLSPCILRTLQIPELAIDQVRLKDVGNQVADNKLSVPLKLFFNITKRCNLYCKHCYNSSGESDSPELPLAVVLDTFDALQGRGVFKLTLAGGEPLAHREISKILEHLTSTPLCISIVTNGIPINDCVFGLLINLPHRSSLTVSLDGATENDNDRVRGAGSFKRAVRNIKRLTKACGYPVSVRLTICRANVDRVCELPFLLKEIGVQELKVNGINPYGRAVLNADLLLAPEEYHAARDKLFHTCASLGIQVEVPSFKYQVDDQGQVGLCKAGTETCEIDGDGSVYPCSFSFGRFCAGNVKTRQFDAIFDNLRQFSINNEWCYSCKGRGGKQEKTVGYVPKLVTLVPQIRSSSP
jgi:MoaA/NifB/PqqE/SkfB family radical SAM enzyme